MNSRYVDSIECWHNCQNAADKIQDHLESLGFNTNQPIDGDELKIELAMIIQKNLKDRESDLTTYNYQDHIMNSNAGPNLRNLGNDTYRD